MARVRFDKLVEYWDPLLRKAFLDAVQNVRQTSQIEQIAQAIANGNVDAALRAVNLDVANFRPLDRTLTQIFEVGGNATAAGVPLLGQPKELRVRFQFNIRNPAAEQWISDYSSELVSEIIDDQRSMIRNFLRRGLAAGDNPRTTALDLVGRVAPSGKREGGMLGLTSSQEEWVSNYAAELSSDTPTDSLSRNLRDSRFDAAVSRAELEGEAIPAALQEKMVAAYKNRALRYRAETISRTETLTSLHAAQRQAIIQVVDSGEVLPSQVTFIWRTASDDRVRDSHDFMDGQEVSLGEKFITGDGNLLAYPGDPEGPPEDIINCRCWVEPNIDFLSGVN